MSAVLSLIRPKQPDCDIKVRDKWRSRLTANKFQLLRNTYIVDYDLWLKRKIAPVQKLHFIWQHANHFKNLPGLCFSWLCPNQGESYALTTKKENAKKLFYQISSTNLNSKEWPTRICFFRLPNLVYWKSSLHLREQYQGWNVILHKFMACSNVSARGHQKYQTFCEVRFSLLLEKSNVKMSLSKYVQRVFVPHEITRSWCFLQEMKMRLFVTMIFSSTDI